MPTEEQIEWLKAEGLRTDEVEEVPEGEEGVPKVGPDHDTKNQTKNLRRAVSTRVSKSKYLVTAASEGVDQKLWTRAHLHASNLRPFENEYHALRD